MRRTGPVFGSDACRDLRFGSSVKIRAARADGLAALVEIERAAGALSGDVRTAPL
jgi:hypothetical protein